LSGILFLVVGIAVSTYKVFIKDNNDIILNGNVEIQNVNVSFRTSGRVLNILANEGQNVKKGDVLAKIDDDILLAQHELAKSKLSESEVNFEVTKKDFMRNEDLFRKRSIPEKMLDDSRMRYMIAKAQKEAAIANFKISEIQLNDSILRSPVDGTVLVRTVENGENILMGTPAFLIMLNSNTKIKSFVNEDVLSKIKHRGRVHVMIDSAPEEKFDGKVSFISSEAEFTPKNIETKELRTSLMFRIRVTLDGNVGKLKQGMPVTMVYVDD
jgi:HlyD family secretion protein